MSLERNLTRKEQKEYEEWLKEMQETVRLQPIQEETETQKTKRITSLKKDFTKFCRYYISKTLWMPILRGSIRKALS